jgi:hypothetical protein
VHSEQKGTSALAELCDPPGQRHVSHLPLPKGSTVPSVEVRASPSMLEGRSPEPGVGSPLTAWHEQLAATVGGSFPNPPEA